MQAELRLRWPWDPAAKQPTFPKTTLRTGPEDDLLANAGF